MLYTSYYWGQKKGEVISISIYPPSRFNGKHLYFFAPDRPLLNWWKNSAKDANAEKEYARIFRLLLAERSEQIDKWIQQELQNIKPDKTLCCYEKTGLFCHRHIIGEEILKVRIPHLWGGEIGDAIQVKTRN